MYNNKVLLIDDEKETLNEGQEMLMNQGFAVDTFESGTDAWETFQNDFSNYINSVVGDQKVVSLLIVGNQIWIGTSGKGLFLFEKKTDNSFSYKSFRNQTNAVKSDIINCIYKDKSGTI